MARLVPREAGRAVADISKRVTVAVWDACACRMLVVCTCRAGSNSWTLGLSSCPGGLFLTRQRRSSPGARPRRIEMPRASASENCRGCAWLRCAKCHHAEALRVTQPRCAVPTVTQGARCVSRSSQCLCIIQAVWHCQTTNTGGKIHPEIHATDFLVSLAPIILEESSHPPTLLKSLVLFTVVSSMSL